MEPELFAKSLINWYLKNKRELPWRQHKNPYFIWLSEIILQQTRVNQGLPYYERFVESYPTIFALANAPEPEVLRLWQGLGYYSRARNLHITAKKIASDFQGNFPDRFSELLKLKGVGRYTAAAIASFAYQERVAVVDGNVYRVLARVFGLKDDIASPAAQKKFQELADELLPKKNSDTYNQAIMEFGALHCTPQNPKCNECPLASMCYALEHKMQSELPVKIKKTAKVNRYFNYLVFHSEGNYYMKERAGKDIWGGLYEFFLIEEKKLLNEDQFKKYVKGVDFVIEKSSEKYKHVLSHRTLHVQFWILRLTNVKKSVKTLENLGLKSYKIKKINDLPKPILIERFLKGHLY